MSKITITVYYQKEQKPLFCTLRCHITRCYNMIVDASYVHRIFSVCLSIVRQKINHPIQEELATSFLGHSPLQERTVFAVRFTPPTNGFTKAGPVETGYPQPHRMMHRKSSVLPTGLFLCFLVTAGQKVLLHSKRPAFEPVF